MNLISWMLIGTITGLISFAFNPQKQEGVLKGNVLISVVGALLGGIGASILLHFADLKFSFISLSFATWGSVITVMAVKSLDPYLAKAKTFITKVSVTLQNFNTQKPQPSVPSR